MKIINYGNFTFMPHPKGVPNPNAGRKRGGQNKATIEFKDAVTNLLNFAMPNMVNWLETIAADNPEKALDMIHKYAQFAHPLLARSESTTTNINLNVTLIDQARERFYALKNAKATTLPTIENKSSGGTSGSIVGHLKDG